jgi:hypothetical protein
MTEEPFAIHRGRCRCGRVSFTLRGEPTGVGVCHCESCRRATGSAFATYVDVLSDQVAIEGEIAIYESRPGVERLFCSACGSPIAYRDRGDEPAETALHLGAFDDPSVFAPDNATYAEESLDWALNALAPLMTRSGRPTPAKG